MSFIRYIADENHYKQVLSLVGKAKQTVWIGTADIKDLYVEDKPFLAMLAGLLKKGVEVRLIHAKEPGTAWREDHEKHPILYDGMERVLCPRVHFKLIIIDSTIAYVGSANLTGAGMGMKSPRKRNFEAGILTDDPEMLDEAINQFDNVWIGKFCKDCGRREYCIDPIKKYLYEKSKQRNGFSLRHGSVRQSPIYYRQFHQARRKSLWCAFVIGAKR